ncbi:MAG: P-loop NTPase [Thermoguttaceae bacterium]
MTQPLPITTGPDQVSPQALERYDHPRNYGPLPQWNGRARITGPCGDTMEFWLEVADGRIAKVGFTTDGCGPSRAAGSMATELALGKRPGEAALIGQGDILAALGGLPQQWEHCALLASQTLQAAVQDFLASLAKERPAECRECPKSECPSKQRRPDESEQEFRQRQALTQRMCRIGWKLMVLSGKGGVGKSTVAANLAVSLMLAGKSVGLLDVDVHGPSIPKLMGLDDAQLAVSGGEILPLEIGESLKVMSIGFLLPERSASVIWRGPMKHGVIRQFLKDVAWGRLDYLVIDSPPGTGDEPLSVAQLVPQPAGAILVCTPQELAVADVRRSVTFCQRVSLPVIGIIENMSGLVCPHCGGQIELFKTGGAEALAREMHVPFLGRIPIDPNIVDCGDSGIPYVRRFSESPGGRAFAEAVRRIVEQVESIKPSPALS